jgi:hypothetical protein
LAISACGSGKSTATSKLLTNNEIAACTLINTVPSGDFARLNTGDQTAQIHGMVHFAGRSKDAILKSQAIQLQTDANQGDKATINSDLKRLAQTCASLGMSASDSRTSVGTVP